MIFKFVYFKYKCWKTNIRDLDYEVFWEQMWSIACKGLEEKKSKIDRWVVGNDKEEILSGISAKMNTFEVYSRSNKQ